MRLLALAAACLFSSPASLRAGEPRTQTPPRCLIAVFFAGDAPTRVSCPSGTPLNVIMAIVGLLDESSYTDVILDVTRTDVVEHGRSTRWIFLDLSEAGTRINVSSDTPWNVLPGLMDAVTSLGYSPDARLVHFSEMIELDAKITDRWRWNVSIKSAGLAK